MLEADSQITQELFKVPSFALNIMPVDKHICMHHFVSKGMEGSKLCCCGPLKTLIHPARSTTGRSAVRFFHWHKIVTVHQTDTRSGFR